VHYNLFGLLSIFLLIILFKSLWIWGYVFGSFFYLALVFVFLFSLMFLIAFLFGSMYFYRPSVFFLFA